MKKTIFLFLIIILLAGCAKKEQDYYLKIKEQNIKVELAETEQERIKGLSGRENLCDNCGILFIFNKEDFHSFWMKEMKFPIDIIWINNDKIVQITKNADLPQAKNIPTYTPKQKASKVLEVNAGFCEKHNIKVGDKVLFLWKK
ncbi:DUF192 domain-containing protein [Candidatus Parcubacteria bacterium]|nr:DUF192 domain-containing protein [Candidatus Parcubacteria bacterium]